MSKWCWVEIRLLSKYCVILKKNGCLTVELRAKQSLNCVELGKSIIVLRHYMENSNTLERFTSKVLATGIIHFKGLSTVVHPSVRPLVARLQGLIRKLDLQSNIFNSSIFEEDVVAIIFYH